MTIGEEEKQLHALATYIVTNLLNKETPEKLHRYMSYRKPVLETIQLKVNNKRTFQNTNWQQDRTQALKVLPTLADQFPYPKSIQRTISSFPDAAWELDNIVENVIQKLIHQSANVLVVGKNSVGKSAVLKQAFKRLANQVRKNQLDYTFWNMMSQRITASAKYLGEWQWIQDVIQLIKTGGQGAEDSVAAFLLPFLQQGQLQMVGEVSPTELDSLRRLLPGFTDLLTKML